MERPSQLHIYLGFHNCFYSDSVLGNFLFFFFFFFFLFLFFALQIRKQEGECGKETILMVIQ